MQRDFRSDIQNTPAKTPRLQLGIVSNGWEKCMDSQLAFTSAKKLAAKIRRRSIGCLELLDFYLDRVRRHNPRLNAIVVADIEAARRRAKAADRLSRSSGAQGPLHGVPMTIKESFDVIGFPTSWGLPQFKDNYPVRNALAVEQLTSAGAILFGKTNVPVMLADWQTFNPLYGTTNNPWDLERTPGGSSGGAASALASGMTALEIGSDIGASIRNPAHYCGVYGHKPTFGVCAADGQNLPGVLSHKDIAVIGPMARHAEDLALALDIIAGPNAVDGRAWRIRLPRAGKSNLRDYRVGVLLSAKTAEVDAEVQGTIQCLVERLARKGVKVTDQVPAINLDQAHRVFIQLLRSATSTSLNDEEFAQAAAASRKASLQNDDYAQWMVRGQSLSHREWQAWHERRLQLAAAWESYFEHFDFLLCPAAATTAFRHNHVGERWERMISVNGKPQPSTTQMFWAGLSGMAYLPSTIAPIGLGMSSGLPVGVQIVGPQYSDHSCIAFAELIGREWGGFSPPPAFL